MRDSTTEVDVKFALKPAFRALMYPAMWFFMLLCVSYGVATTSTGQFLPRIVHQLGYSAVQTNLHLMAPDLTGCVITLLVAWLSDHYKERGTFLCLGLSFTMIGYIMASALDPIAQTGACYAEKGFLSSNKQGGHRTTGRRTGASEKLPSFAQPLAGVLKLARGSAWD
ncbi:uncharacterized protein ACHE_80773S [Aspergillus chevalieri]|uniref:Uncharacterized protein n=1 Tax=Aspergillus chevalieri TaxID=182096 RepID=A0A7R7VYZ2_ASPCH|nr:uncharacterized protein ACHE_80773S [Aspergillus chevalieri]BCR92873.1 hypothetical protein ACHE_80773S [Aspergillus chevalieri]